MLEWVSVIMRMECYDNEVLYAYTKAFLRYEFIPWWHSFSPEPLPLHSSAFNDSFLGKILKLQQPWRADLNEE